MNYTNYTTVIIFMLDLLGLHDIASQFQALTILVFLCYIPTTLELDRTLGVLSGETWFWFWSLLSSVLSSKPVHVHTSLIGTKVSVSDNFEGEIKSEKSNHEEEPTFLVSSGKPTFQVLNHFFPM